MAGTSPRNFLMTLGTARDIAANPEGYKPHIAAEARRVVAYWGRLRARQLRQRQAAFERTSMTNAINLD